MDPKKDCLCAKVRKASRGLTGFYDRFLAPAGLRVTQYSLLRNIQRLDRATASKLAGRLLMDKTTLTRNLRLLEAKGLISIRADEDRRVKVINLTERGRVWLDRAAPCWEAAQARAAERLGQSRLDRLFEDLTAAEDLAE